MPIGGARGFGRGASRKSKNEDVVEQLRKVAKPLRERQAEYVENHLAIPADRPALDAVDAMEKAIREIEALRQERDQYRKSVRFQHRRMIEASKIWQQATGNHDVLPDLGDLLQFLMDRTTVTAQTAAKMIGDKELQISNLKQVVSTAEMAIRGTQLEFALLDINGPALGEFLNNSLGRGRSDA